MTTTSHIRAYAATTCFTLALASLTAEPAMAQKGKKGGGGGGDGGSGSVPIQYVVDSIPGLGLGVAARDMNNLRQVVGDLRGPSNSSFDAFLYSGGSTFLLDDLLDALDPAARNGWHLRIAYAINDSGQISGEAEKDGQRLAFLFDPIATTPFVILPQPAGMESDYTVAFEINNSTDLWVAVETGAGYQTYFYSATTQNYTHLGEVIGRWGMTDRNNTGLVTTIGLGSRTTIDAFTGTVVLDEELSGMTPYAINNQGTAAGWADGSKGVVQTVARYATQLEKLKDGRKDLSGVAYAINESDDLGFESEQMPWIYTDEQGKLMLDDLIHPDSVAVYTEGISRNEIVRIGERDGTGFFPILDLAVRSDGVLESFLLSPQTPE